MLGNGRTCRPRVRVSALALAIFSVISIGAVISAKADEDDLKKGPSFRRAYKSPRRLPPDRRSRP